MGGSLLRALVALIGGLGFSPISHTRCFSQFSVTPAPRDLKPLASVGTILLYLPTRKHIHNQK